MITQQQIIDNVNKQLQIIKANEGRYANDGWWSIKYKNGKWFYYIRLIRPEKYYHPEEKELKYEEVIECLIDNEIQQLYADKIQEKWKKRLKNNKQA